MIDDNRGAGRTPRRIRCLAAVLAIFCAGAALANGVRGEVERFEVHRNGVTMQISAPRDDIIRVRAAQGELGEDASWAVASGVRRSVRPMRLARDGAADVLRTQAMVVRIDRMSLRLTILDAQGRVVLDDAADGALEFDPARAKGTAGLRLRKQMPADAHYFGLGDKTGPLDRRGEAFTLWNTDAYGFGESTDPLYKAIPFVLGVLESGRASVCSSTTPGAVSSISARPSATACASAPREAPSTITSWLPRNPRASCERTRS